MDCQTIIKNNIRLNKNRRIGTVIFVVEGNKTEVNLLKKIFSEILDYTFVSENRDGKRLKFKSRHDKYSIIYVFNSENSNIKSIDDDELEEHLSEEIRKLYDENFSIANSAIFYIFDRDLKSNRIEVVEHLIKKYTSSREAEDYGLQGLLLLSYPAVEAYICECLVDKYYKHDFLLGVTLKKYLQNRQIKIEDIKEKNVIKAVKSMHKTLRHIGVNSYDIDNFYNANKAILDIQETYASDNGDYKILSLISVALIDLGIIEVIEDEQWWLYS